MIFFQNIYILIANPNLKFEYKEIDEDDVMCNCNLCHFIKMYVFPIFNFFNFQIKT
jgi:hypothetical protein